MARMTDDTRRELAWGDKHRALAKSLGWRLFGWSGEYAASFYGPKDEVIDLDGVVLATLYRLQDEVDRLTRLRQEQDNG